MKVRIVVVRGEEGPLCATPDLSYYYWEREGESSARINNNKNKSDGNKKKGKKKKHTHTYTHARTHTQRMSSFNVCCVCLAAIPKKLWPCFFVCNL